MKKLLLTSVLVFAMAIPAFAQNGPIKIKPLMVYTSDGSGSPTSWFTVGETIGVANMFEIKGTGTFRIRLEVRNSAGVLIEKEVYTETVDNNGFGGWTIYGSLSPEVPEVPGYYTVKFVYVDLANRNTWSHQTKIHVEAP